MTVSGAWSRYRRARRQSPRAWAVGSRFSPTPLIKTWRLAFGQPSLIIVRTSSAATSGSFVLVRWDAWVRMVKALSSLMFAGRQLWP